MSSNSQIFKNGPNGNGHGWEIKYRAFSSNGPPGTVYAICATISAEDTNSSP
jgi:hypothetical protein